MLNKLGALGAVIGVVWVIWLKLKDYYFTSKINSANTQEQAVNEQIVKTKIAIDNAKQSYDEALKVYEEAKRNNPTDK